MPAAHWSILPLAVAAAALFRRRAAATDGSADGGARRLPSVEDFLSTQASDHLVHSYAYAGCTDREIADRFGLTEADLRERYATVLTKTRAARAFHLRKAQTDLAAGPPAGGKPAGNGPTLIWLGRNELGQALSPAAQGVAEPEVTDDLAV